MRLIWLGLFTLSCAFCAASASGAASPPAVAVAGEPGQSLIIGRISSGARKQLSKLDALNDYVVSGMADVGIANGHSVIERTIADMAALMAASRVDYVTESLYGAIRLEAEGGGEIILQEWKGGTAYFRTLLIGHAQADIRMDSLHGRHILFEDPGSTSGYFLPYVYLRSNGYRLARRGSPEAAGRDVVTYSFAGAETTIAARLARRKAELGAISNNDWIDRKKTPLSLRPALRVIDEIGLAPRRLVIVRRDLDPRVKQALIRILIDMAHSAEGRSALDNYKTDSFGLLTPETSREIKAARAAYEQYAEELD